MPKLTKPNSCGSPMVRAWAFGLNANNAAQNAAQSIAILGVGIMFSFIGFSGLVEAKAVPEDHLLRRNVIKLYAVDS